METGATVAFQEDGSDGGSRQSISRSLKIYKIKLNKPVGSRPRNQDEPEPELDLRLRVLIEPRSCPALCPVDQTDSK